MSPVDHIYSTRHHSSAPTVDDGKQGALAIHTSPHRAHLCLPKNPLIRDPFLQQRIETKANFFVMAMLGLMALLAIGNVVFTVVC